MKFQFFEGPWPSCLQAAICRASLPLSCEISNHSSSCFPFSKYMFTSLLLLLLLPVTLLFGVCTKCLFFDCNFNGVKIKKHIISWYEQVWNSCGQSSMFAQSPVTSFCFPVFKPVQSPLHIFWHYYYISNPESNTIYIWWRNNRGFKIVSSFLKNKEAAAWEGFEFKITVFSFYLET